jgi:hypothetical protein
MKTSKDKIMQALSGLLPENVSADVVAAVEIFIEETKATLDKEYDAKLDEAYKQVAADKLEVEKVAEQGYAEAYSIISDLRDRLEVQREEFEQALEEGYEEAYQLLLAERSKNENLEVDLYDEYDKKLAEIKEYMVEKLDLFLSTKGEEFYEQAKRDVLNDPMVSEHKLALDRILEVASNYLSDDDFLAATGTKVEEMKKQLDDIKGQQRILEAKNMRLATENSKLNEAVRQQQELLTEGVRSEQKERLKKSRTVEGRGQKAVDNPVVIGEHTAEVRAATNDEEEQGTRFVESSAANNMVEQWRHLAAVPTQKKK